MDASPNLYHFATSELSQDATLAYLLAWADNRYRTDKTGMHEFGRDLLIAMLAPHDRGLPAAAHVTILRQKYNIDVLVVVSIDDSTPSLALIIEDKTFTRVQNPFRKYRKRVEEGLSIAAADIFVTVVSLGNQFLYADPDRPFQIFRRSELLTILQRDAYMGVQNTILQNFKAHYESHHAVYETHRSELPPDQWTSPRMWEGYYQYLCALPDEEAPFWHYGYAANESGGTWWCASRTAGTFWGYSVYLQLEYSNKAVPSLEEEHRPQCLMVFKLGPVADHEERNSEIARSFYALLDAAAVEHGYRTAPHPGQRIVANNRGQVLKRPLSLRAGEYVSCGLVAEGDWFVGGEREMALEQLRRFYRFLQEAL